MSRRIDAHQHFWRYEASAYPWIPAGSPLATGHMPAQLAPLLESAGIDGCIAVQARQDEAETDWLLALAREHDFILGIVGWVDLTASDASARIQRRCAEPKLVGLRHIVQAEPDGYLAREDVRRGVRTALEAGLAYDVLVHGRQTPQVPAFLDAVGEGRIVLDHIGKPDIRSGVWSPWAEAVSAIAGFPHVVCKVSGLVTEADPTAWQLGDFDRYLDHVLTCFGPDRLMFGSDWPVCRLAAEYDGVVEIVERFAGSRGLDRTRLFGSTAEAAYALPPG